MKLVVTGCSSGIGRATALRAVREGWEVLASVRSSDQRAALEREGCTTALLELREAGSIGAFAEEATRWCGGRLQGLVNNAGISLPGAVEEQDIEDIRTIFEVNVFGHVQLTQRLLPALRAARGRIVFVSSRFVSSPAPLYGAYIASKRALGAFADVLALELRSFGVEVKTLELGAYESNVRTAIRERFAAIERAGSVYSDLVKEMSAKVGQPPLGQADDAARAVLGLLGAR